MDGMYVDGSVYEGNPSFTGGAWAWIYVLDGKEVASGLGMVTPKDMRTEAITNNLTELLAAVQAMESIPDGELLNGKIYTDSDVTRHRLLGSPSYKGIPDELRRRSVYQVHRLKPQVQLIAGHPSKKDLAAGRRRKDGALVSKWNVECDARCTNLSRIFLTFMDVKDQASWDAWRATVDVPNVHVGFEDASGSTVTDPSQNHPYDVLVGKQRPCWMWIAKEWADVMKAWHNRQGWEPWKE